MWREILGSLLIAVLAERAYSAWCWRPFEDDDDA